VEYYGFCVKVVLCQCPGSLPGCHIFGRPSIFVRMEPGTFVDLFHFPATDPDRGILFSLLIVSLRQTLAWLSENISPKRGCPNFGSCLGGADLPLLLGGLDNTPLRSWENNLALTFLGVILWPDLCNPVSFHLACLFKGAHRIATDGLLKFSWRLRFGPPRPDGFANYDLFRAQHRSKIRVSLSALRGLFPPQTLESIRF